MKPTGSASFSTLVRYDEPELNFGFENSSSLQSGSASFLCADESSKDKTVLAADCVKFLTFSFVAVVLLNQACWVFICSASVISIEVQIMSATGLILLVCAAKLK